MLKKRIFYIDLVKAIAIIMVVYCHVLPDNIFTGSWSWMLALRPMGVPLFVMCTGALMLDRDFTSIKNITKFYKKNFLTLLITS